MLNGQLSNEERQQILETKEKAVGSIQNDRVDELPEVEYLQVEIKDSQAKRRSHSMPFFAIGIVVLIFSAAGETPLTQIVGTLVGVCSLAAAFWIVIKRTKKLAELREKLEGAESAPKSEQD